jgi:hypothetical protein
MIEGRTYGSDSRERGMLAPASTASFNFASISAADKPPSSITLLSLKSTHTDMIETEPDTADKRPRQAKTQQK